MNQTEYTDAMMAHNREVNGKIAALTDRLMKCISEYEDAEKKMEREETRHSVAFPASTDLHTMDVESFDKSSAAVREAVEKFDSAKAALQSTYDMREIERLYLGRMVL